MPLAQDLDKWSPRNRSHSTRPNCPPAAATFRARPILFALDCKKRTYEKTIPITAENTNTLQTRIEGGNPYARVRRLNTASSATIVRIPPTTVIVEIQAIASLRLEAQRHATSKPSSRHVLDANCAFKA